MIHLSLTVLIFLRNQSLVNVHAELNLSQGDLPWKAKVFSRTKDRNGDAKGSHDPNAFIKTLTCDVELPHGKIKYFSANVIAENMHAQVDDDGHDVQMLDAIVYYRKDRNKADKDDTRLRTKSRQQILRKTTSG